MRAGLYVRISDDREGAGLGVKRQEVDCRKLVERHGWKVADVFVDNDRSAYSGKARPAYRQLLEAVEAGDIDAVVAWHPDRLHRSPVELEAFIDLVERHHVAVSTVTAGEYDLSTPTGRMTARVAGAVARHESEHKATRARRKHEELAERGKRNGGVVPFGWRDGGRIDAAQAKVVREAASRVLAGDTLRSIVGDLNARGGPAPTSGRWNTTTLRRILTSWSMCGVRSLHDEPITVGEWQPILERADVESLRRILLDSSRRTNRNPRRYLLSGGLLVCGRCGAAMVARPTADKRRKYVCAKGPGFSGCGRMASLAEPLEAFVADMVFARVASPALAEAIAVASTSVSEDDVGAEVARLERKLDELADDFAADRIGRREWLRARDRVEALLSAERDELGRRTQTSSLTGFVGVEGALGAAWEAMGFDQRRAVLAAVVEAVTLAPAVWGRNFFDPDRVTFTWRV